jgi:hypothetical protein
MTLLRTVVVLFSLGIGWSARADIKADPPEAKTEAKPDKEGFVPVSAAEQLAPGEALPATNLVGAAYGFILAALVVWIASVAVRARKVEEELATLRTRIDRAKKQG